MTKQRLVASPWGGFFVNMFFFALEEASTMSLREN
jgi:hypothetical protein